MAIKGKPILGILPLLYLVNAGFNLYAVDQNEKVLPAVRNALGTMEIISQKVWERHKLLDPSSPTYDQELAEWRAYRDSTARDESFVRRIADDLEMGIVEHKRRKWVVF